jgi:Escherichia/Staphylococcus phage prohead protease
MSANKERYSNSKAEFRATNTGGTGKITGYAAVFNSRTQIGDFIEIIAPGAFAKVLATKPDVRMLRNHNSDLLLGRTTNGTLTLWEDQKGLCFMCLLPDTREAEDTFALIERGDMTGCSFGFSIAPGGETWTKEGGIAVRTITEVGELYDASVVTFPAYESATVTIARALAEKDIFIPTPPTNGTRALAKTFVHEDIQRFNLMVVYGRKAMEQEICWRDKMQQQAELEWSPENRQAAIKQVRESNVLIKTLESQVAQCIEHIRALEFRN